MSGTEIPRWFKKMFEGLDQKPNIRKMIAAVSAVEQCRILYKNGINDFHFYTLNRSDLTRAICHILQQTH